MEVEIVAIGNELLLGETVDRNSAHIARRLSTVGARVVRTTHVGDDPPRLAAVLRDAAARSRWIITTGGLGPTRDDLTREVVAEVFGRPLRLDPDLLAGLEERFRRFGYEGMPAANRAQAWVPDGARVLPNGHGTAPGLMIEDEACTAFVLPGVPHEMEALLEEAVLPRLIEVAGEGAPVVRSRLIRTAGIGESALAERIDEIVAAGAPVEVAFLPDLGQVDVRLTAAGLPVAEAERRLEGLTAAILERCDRWVYGQGDATLAGAVLAALRARGWSLGVAESCTGGGLGAEITTVPGASDVFVGGVIAYGDRVKIERLDVSAGLLQAHGAVSEAVCRAMVSGVRQELGVDVGCAITGVAGPGGGTTDKPVGLVWIGVGTPRGTAARCLDYPGSRAAIRRRATIATLALLLRVIREGA